jgi:DNA-binding transcriptional LysR family regulator
MRSGSVVAAADQIGVSQPNVSRLLHDMEAELGYRLFAKRGRGLVPTPAARALYAEVERSLVGLGRITAIARQLRGGSKGSVTLGSNYSASFDLVYAAIAELKSELPDVSVSLRIQTSATLIDWVRIGFVDLALVNLYGDFQDVEVVAERELSCVCVLPAGHALLGKDDPIDLRELHSETLIIPDEATLSSLIPDVGIREKIMEHAWLDVQIWYPVAAAVEHGLGIGIADPLSAAFLARSKKIACRPMAQHLPYRLALLRQPGSSPSDSSECLSGIISRRLQRI